MEGSSSSESDSTEFESSSSAPSVSDGLESDEEQSKSRLDIAGWPLNTGRCQTQPTSCTLFSNIMVGKKVGYNT